MTGFDHQFRTDQFNAQQRQFYDQQSLQSQREMNQTIGNLPQALQQAQANKQMMQLRATEAEMAKVRLESNLRAQEVATQAQFNKNKMVEMQMIDQLDLSALNVQAARNNIKEQELRLKDSQRQFDASHETDSHKRRLDMLKALGGPAFARATGQIFTIGEDGQMTFEEASSPEALEQFANSLEKRSSKASAEDRYIADGARRMAKALADRYRNALGEIVWPDTEEGKRAKEQYMRYMGIAQQFYNRFAPAPNAPAPAAAAAAAAASGASAPSGGSPLPQVNTSVGLNAWPPKPISQPAQPGSAIQKVMADMTPGQQAMTGQVQHLFQNPSSSFASLMSEASEDDQAGIAAMIGRAASDLVENNRTTPDRAVQLVMQRFERGGKDLARTLAAANYSFDQIRAVLRSKPNHSDERVDSIMKWLQQTGKTLATKPGAQRIQQGMDQRESLRAQHPEVGQAPDLSSDINVTGMDATLDDGADTPTSSEVLANAGFNAPPATSAGDVAYNYKADVEEAADLVRNLKQEIQRRKKPGQDRIANAMQDREQLRVLDEALTRLEWAAEKEPDLGPEFEKDLKRARAIQSGVKKLTEQAEAQSAANLELLKSEERAKRDAARGEKALNELLEMEKTINSLMKQIKKAESKPDKGKK